MAGGRERGRAGDDAFGIEPNWAAAAAAAAASVRRRGRSQWLAAYPSAPTPQFVGGGFGGWYLSLPPSLSLSVSLSPLSDSIR